MLLMVPGVHNKNSKIPGPAREKIELCTGICVKPY